MAKALDFIDPDKLSMTVVLTAMNRFLNEDNGLQMAFLDGNQPERLCKPMVDYIEKRGGQVLLNKPVKEIVLKPDNSIDHILLRNGEKVVADEYVSAMPVDIVKRLLPRQWSTMPYFLQLNELEGIPVINLHLWFDRKLKAVDHLCFSRSPLLSVYADMSVTCKEYADEKKSMLELVFAPCSPLAGGKINWLARTDEEIIAATLKELERLFPTEVWTYTIYSQALRLIVVSVWFCICLIKLPQVTSILRVHHPLMPSRSPPTAPRPSCSNLPWSRCRALSTPRYQAAISTDRPSAHLFLTSH